MRILACIMVVITLLVGCFVGFCYFGAQMVIEGVYPSVVPAVEALGTYTETKDQILQGTFLGNNYRDVDFLMPDGYAFLTLTVRLSNKGLLAQDWIQIEVINDAADVAQLPLERTPTLVGMSRADFSTTLLTQVGSDTSRRIKVTYYVAGWPFSAEYEMQ